MPNVESKGDYMRRSWLMPIFAVFYTLISLSMSSGQSAIVSLDHPLPQVFRRNAETMMQSLRPRDATEASKNLYATKNSDLQPEWVILRVQYDCKLDICMTIITRNSDERMVPEVIVGAGRSVYVADSGYPLWGSDAWAPIVFQGEGGAALGVTRRGDRWVFDACAKCLEWPALTAVPPPAPPPQPAHAQPQPMNFDEFKQRLGK